MARPAQKAEGGLRVSARVTPKAGRDAIAGASRDEAGQYRLMVKVAAPPADGAANTAVVAVVAKAFGVAKSYVRILRGETAREKLLLIEGDTETLEARFAELEKDAIVTAQVIDGKAFAAGLRERVAAAVTKLKAEHNLQPGLAVVLVGEDPASEIYVRSKAKQTVEAGMNSFEHKLPATTTQEELLAVVEQLNNDPKVHGILVQLPLPKQISEEAVINAIDPAKDVDGFHVINAGRLATGQSAMVPCTPFGCLLLIKDQLGDLSGKTAVVIGRSNIVGKPMAQLLLGESCTVTIAHSRTKDLPSVVRQADIVVAAVGRPLMVKGDWIKPGAVVVDVGINRIPAPEKGEGATRVVGDVDYAEVSQVAGAVTPVPGGVGPMTIACLLRNATVAACRQAGLPDPEGL